MEARTNGAVRYSSRELKDAHALMEQAMRPPPTYVTSPRPLPCKLSPSPHPYAPTETFTYIYIDFLYRAFPKQNLWAFLCRYCTYVRILPRGMYILDRDGQLLGCLFRERQP